MTSKPKLFTPEQYEAMVDRSGGPDACHPWSGHLDHRGSASFKQNGRAVQAHRYFYELLVGQLREPYLLRTCLNLACCNPAHSLPSKGPRLPPVWYPAFFVCSACGDGAPSASKALSGHLRCQGCRGVTHRNWRAANIDHNRAEHLRWRVQNAARYLFSFARIRSRNSGVPFLITHDDVSVPSHCPVLGIPLMFRHSGRGQYDESPTLDRIVPSLGYVAGNVAVISGRANRIKNVGSADEHEAVAAWMRKVQR